MRNNLDENSRILVFQVDNRPWDCGDYPTYSSLIIQQYCKRYNYEYRYFQREAGRDRHPSWARLPVILELFETTDYDLYVYLDTDCIFKEWMSIPEYLNSCTYLNSDTAPITFLSNKPFEYDKPCAGVFFATKDNWEMFRTWWDVHIPEFDRVHPYDQAGLHKILPHVEVNVIDDWMFKEQPNQFIRHVCSTESYLRMEYFREYYIKRIAQ